MLPEHEGQKWSSSLSGMLYALWLDVLLSSDQKQDPEGQEAGEMYSKITHQNWQQHNVVANEAAS